MLIQNETVDNQNKKTQGRHYHLYERNIEFLLAKEVLTA